MRLESGNNERKYCFFVRIKAFKTTHPRSIASVDIGAGHCASDAVYHKAATQSLMLCRSRLLSSLARIYCLVVSALVRHLAYSMF